MGKVIDLRNKKFGRLTVLDENPLIKGNYTMWKCQCECGNIKYINGGSLRAGRTKSCGCIVKETAPKNGPVKLWEYSPVYQKKEVYKYAKYYNGYHSNINIPYRIKYIFNGMKQRCNNPNHDSYKYYGGRGIKVCDEWLDKDGLLKFYEWSVANGYKEDLSIDRIDNYKGYSPQNCRWVTSLEQAHNKRKK